MRISKTKTRPRVATVWLDHDDMAAWQTPEGRARLEAQADRLVSVDKCQCVRVYATTGALVLEVSNV